MSKMLVSMERNVFFHEDDVVLSTQYPRHGGHRSDKYVRSDKALQMWHLLVKKNMPPDFSW
jgi:hypothetical protein